MKGFVRASEKVRGGRDQSLRMGGAMILSCLDVCRATLKKKTGRRKGKAGGRKDRAFVHANRRRREKRWKKRTAAEKNGVEGRACQGEGGHPDEGKLPRSTR